jgi:hypothetical protein
MDINEKELAKLHNMLASYEKEHGTIAEGSPESTNCATCSGSCDNFCTNGCHSYCDGHSGSCWQVGER